MSRPPAYHAGSSTRQIRSGAREPPGRRWRLIPPDPERDRGADGGRERGRDWVLLTLAVLAVLSRLVWAVWVHPPQDHVFSDMAHYVHRARLLASLDVGPGDRAMAWQAWGTHALLAIPLVLLGPGGESALELAGLIWAGFSAATVVLSYRLAIRVLPDGRADGPSPDGPSEGRRARPHWPATAVGVAALLWFPLLSHTGFFVSETPYACVLLATTNGIVALIQTGRGAVRAGLLGAVAFALRPQVAVFLALLGLAWLLDRRRARAASGERRGSWSRRVGWRAVVWFAAPLLAVLVLSMIRVRVYTGELGGVAENASMNLTAGRCHNIVTRAYPDRAALESARATGRPRASRRVSLPGFRALGRERPDHPLALRPALGGESIDFVGYIGDREAHRAIRRRCYAATGLAGQLRYSATNVALLWMIARPWPESSDRGAPELLPVAVRGRDLAAWLAPLALLGLVLALVGWRRAARSEAGRAGELERRAGLGVCALQLLSLLLTAAVFFGTPRLRTPYDPYALILIAALAVELVVRVRRRAPTSELPCRAQP